ncbi:hypothetical protein JOM56_009803, partial [Amanita muscaria]
ERLKKKWSSSVYAFFKPDPIIEQVGDDRIHAFVCNAVQCLWNGKNGWYIRRNLSTKDATSTGNLRSHAKKCWGEEIVKKVSKSGDVHNTRAILEKCSLKDGTITAAFERVGKDSVTYSHRQHTTSEARAAFVRWIAQSGRPFEMVNDEGFHALMKTGRLWYEIPSPTTVS